MASPVLGFVLFKPLFGQDERHQRRGKVEIEKLSNPCSTNDLTTEVITDEKQADLVLRPVIHATMAGSKCSGWIAAAPIKGMRRVGPGNTTRSIGKARH